MFADDLDRLAALHANGQLNDAEFARAKERVLGGESATASASAGAGAGATTAPLPPFTAALNGLRRSRSDRWLGGVCGGIARLTGLESWVWRIVFTLLLLAGGCSLALYLLLWLFVPSE